MTYGVASYGASMYGSAEYVPVISQRYAFPMLGGVRLVGSNIVPRATDSGNMDNNPTPQPANFYQLLYEWGTGGPTDPAWTHWVKPQIDFLFSIGANCVRLILNGPVLYGDSTHSGAATFTGTLTLLQLTNIIDQIATYLASKGMWFYPSLLEAADADALTAANVANFITDVMPIVSSTSYHNIIGVDVVNEHDRSTYASAGTNLTTLMNAARAARSKAIPLTCSIATYVNWSTAIPRCISAGCQFLDFHTYLATTSFWLNLVTPNGGNLPIVTGETGVGYNGYFFDYTRSAQEATHPFSSELRRRHYENVVSGFGHRWDAQLTETWAAVKEWPTDNQDWGMASDAQDANFAFTGPRPEMTGPFQTNPTVQPVYNIEHVLDLSGPDTTQGAWSANSTFMLGWGQFDYSGLFTRVSHRVRRQNGTIGPGVINLYGLPCLDQSISVDFDASLAIGSGGQTDWTISVRHVGDGPLTLDTGKFYFVDLASNPLNGSIDGQFAIYRSNGSGSFTLLDNVDIGSVNLAHSYRMTLSASGIFPTTLVATLTDLTAGSLLSTRTITDSTAALQVKGVAGLPKQIGEVYYTNVRYVMTNDLGPSLLAPVLGAVTNTTMPISWTAATGGKSPFTYIPQYAPVDSNGFPSADWTLLPPQAGLSKTITGLSANTRYAVRVQVIDNAYPWGMSYSPWLVTSTIGATTVAVPVGIATWVTPTISIANATVVAVPVGIAVWETPAISVSQATLPQSVTAPMKPILTLEAELSGVGGGWTDISRDVLADSGVSIRTGIDGGAPGDLVAGTGTASFQLNNSETNSAGLLGYYSPYHANKRTGWGVGIGCRVRFQDPNTSLYTTRFVGRIDVINPVPGVHGERSVSVTAADWMDEAARWLLTPAIGEQVGQRWDDILRAILAQMPRQPTAVSFDVGADVYPYATDTSSITNQSALAEFAKLAASEFGPIYITKDGTLRAEGRHTRLLTTTSDWTIPDTDLRDLEMPTTRDEIINTVRVTIHPRVVDTFATTLVYEQANAIFVPAGQSKQLLGPYRDPVSGDPIGATDVQTPAASVTYLANQKEDGSGTDLTSVFTVVVSKGSAGALFTVTNTGGTDGNLTRNLLYGRGVYDRGAQQFIATDSGSIMNNGEHAVNFDMPYQSDDDTGQGAADYILAKYSAPFAQARRIEVIAKSATLLAQILLHDVSGRLVISETLTGLSSSYFINGIELTVLPSGHLAAAYMLAPAEDPMAGLYWILGTSTLGTDTIPAPF